ncbi:hypothetical protein B4U79_10616, partial [Dinothrombium tinctorium]
MTNSLQMEQSSDSRREVILREKPAVVAAVHIDGVSRTKDDFIINMAKQLFTVTNVEDMFMKSAEIQRQFESMQCFKNVRMHIDTSKRRDSKIDYEITFHVVESKRIFGGVNTFIGNHNDGSVALHTDFPNLNGRGESLQVIYQYGTQKTSGINMEFVKPLCPWTVYDPRVVASLFQYGSDFPWSGFREVDRGLALDLRLKYSPIIHHNFRWEGVWRDISSLSPNTSFAVREESGHTLKSSLKHVLTVDKREGIFVPESGSLFQVKQEYAGLGGNVAFHKHEIEFQHNIPVMILTDMWLQTSLRAGIMKNLHNNCITDRFFVGGPLNLRGYQIYGVGPHADGNALGANSYWLCNFHLYSNLPFNLGKSSIGKYCKTHLFLNSGNIVNFNFAGDIYRNTSLLFNKVRFSLGIGLVFHIKAGARLEFHYCVPFNQQIGDKADKGLQFGFGAQFLYFAFPASIISDSKGNPRNITNSKGKKRKPGSKPLSQAVGCNEHEFVDFLSRCLEWNPLHRMTPDEALKHGWMSAIVKVDNKQNDNNASSNVSKSDYRKTGLKSSQPFTSKDAREETFSSSTIYRVYKASKSSAAKSNFKNSIELVTMLKKASSEES